MPLDAGTTLGPYEVVGFIGAGGMGEVYRARDTRLDRTVAIKILPTRFAVNSAARERFDHEARAISSLNHPNICHLYDVGTHDGIGYLVMEYLDGETLADRLLRGPLPLNELLKCATDIAGALECAHRSGIIHRDLKPANVMLTESGAKLMDFGLAKVCSATAEAGPGASLAATLAVPITGAGTVLGTINYMSPEQARGDEVDVRTDLFSAGALLYEMATGRTPFPGRTSAVVFDAILNRDPVPPGDVKPDLADDLGRIIAKCLEKDVEVRYQNAADLRADLKRLRRDASSGVQGRRTPAERAASASSAPAAPSAAEPRVSSSSVIDAARRHKLRTGVGSLVFVALLLAAGFGVYEWLHRTGGVPFQSLEISPVTATGDVAGVALSPDGRYVAYLRREENGSVGLWVRHLATNSNVAIIPAAIVSYSDITFAPDSNYIYVRKAVSAQSSSRELLRVPVFGGNAIPVVHDIDSAPGFSAGSQRLVFQRSNAPQRGTSQFISANLDGSEEKVIFAGKSDRYSAAFSAPSLSPDGKHLAIIELPEGEVTNGVAMVDVASGRASPFFRFAPSSSMEVRLVSWMPDGRGLLVVYRFLNRNHWQVGYISYPGGQFHKVTNDLNDYLRITVSADGRSFATLLQHEEDIISVFPAKYGIVDNESLAAIPGASFGWLTDNEMLVVQNLRDRTVETINVSTRERSVFFSDNSLQPVDVSPCGQDDVLLSGSSTTASGLYRLDRKGGNLRRLTAGKGHERATCSADRRWAIYFDWSDFAIRKVPLAGGTPQVLVPAELSPESDFAAARERNEIATTITQGGAVRFALVSIETGKITQQIPAAGLSPVEALAVTPDGKAIAAAARRNGVVDVWLQPLSGGDPQQLTHHTPSRILDTIWMLRWSPDATRLAVSRRIFRRDAVILHDVALQ